MSAFGLILDDADVKVKNCTIIAANGNPGANGVKGYNGLAGGAGGRGGYGGTTDGHEVGDGGNGGRGAAGPSVCIMFATGCNISDIENIAINNTLTLGQLGSGGTSYNDEIIEIIP